MNFNDTMGALFAQDDWEIARGVTLNLGVRWDVDTLIQGDHNNIAPRVGFAWNVGNTGKTVIRGNTGIFYDTLESSLINRESNFGPVGQAALDLRQGDPLFPTFPNRLTAFPSGAATVPRATVTVPVYEGDEFPLGIGDTLPRVGAVLLQLDDRLPARARAELGDVGRLRGRPRARHVVTLDINAPPYFPLGPGPDAHRGAGQSAPAARRAESHRRPLQHPVHRLPRSAAAVQQRQDAVRRVQARRHAARVGALRSPRATTPTARRAATWTISDSPNRSCPA